MAYTLTLTFKEQPDADMVKRVQGMLGFWLEQDAMALAEMPGCNSINSRVAGDHYTYRLARVDEAAR